MIIKSQYRVIGLMSGTSLDGLDIAYVVFKKLKSGWSYNLERGTTLKYSGNWLERLSQAYNLKGQELMELDASFGSFLGKAARAFMDRHKLKVDFIASHGHTVFHQPSKGFTTQIGNGYSLAAASGLPVVCDFRMQDVAFGGEGAPLVPAGDKFLFGEYDVCLNLGGIANLSVEEKGKRYAYDICFCNMALNRLAEEASMKFDRNGMMASDGQLDRKMLNELSKVYRKYKARRPSLGREIFEGHVAGVLDEKTISLEDRLCTVTESAAIEICNAIRSHSKTARVLCTGGGAFNSYLISRMLEHGGDDITFVIPEPDVVKFKEALVFGFLGVLRVRDEINCLKTVTNALRDTSSGTMIGFKN
jgi:anhydro-N-acetylmuramic acid kinase